MISLIVRLFHYTAAGRLRQVPIGDCDDVMGALLLVRRIVGRPDDQRGHGPVTTVSALGGQQ